MMPSSSQNNSRDSATYEIRVQGRLRPEWGSWFDNLKIELRAEETVLTGPVTDQAALYGLLKRVRNLGLPLLSVRQIETDKSKEKR